MTKTFSDCSGHVDAGAVGGEVEQITVDSTIYDYPSTYSEFSDIYELNTLSGIDVRLFASLSDAGSDLSIYNFITAGNVGLGADKKTVAADTTRKDFITLD